MTNDIIDLMSQSTFDGRDILEAFTIATIFHVKQCAKFRLWQPRDPNQPDLILEEVVEVDPKILFSETLIKFESGIKDTILAEYEGERKWSDILEKIDELNEHYEPTEEDLENLEIMYKFFKEAYNLQDNYSFKELQGEAENECHFVDDLEVRGEAREKAYEFEYVKRGSPIENCIDWDEWAEDYKNDMSEIKHPFRKDRTLYFN